MPLPKVLIVDDEPYMCESLSSCMGTGTISSRLLPERMRGSCSATDRLTLQ
jgi:hypothetical protein